MTIEIIGYPQSTHVRTALLVAAHHGVPVENVMLDTEAVGYPHPFAKMPVLRADGKILYETVAICRYLDTLAKGSVLPKDAWAAAKVVQWHSVADDYLYAAIKSHAFADEKTEDGRNAARHALKVVEQGIEGKMLVGNTPTLADYAVAPCVDYLFQSDPVLAPEFAALSAWLTRVKATSAWELTEPPQQVA